jgi:hypothetical protein
MAKPLLTLWSMAAFEKCSLRFDETQRLVLKGVGELAEKMDGWFFHTFVAPTGDLLRCDAHPEEKTWRVYVRLAEYTGDEPKYPELLKSPSNEKFADFWEIKATQRNVDL